MRCLDARHIENFAQVIARMNGGHAEEARKTKRPTLAVGSKMKEIL
jgi:hypothetical protein